MHLLQPCVRQFRQRDLGLVAPVNGVMLKSTLQRLISRNPEKQRILWHYDRCDVVAR